MRKILYLECASGISGDMFVAAMADLGVDRAGLLGMLEKLQLEHVSFKLEKTCKTALPEPILRWRSIIMTMTTITGMTTNTITMNTGILQMCWK